MKRKIFVASYGSKGTGGTESLHQLAKELSDLNFDVYIYYVDGLSTPENLKKYCVKTCNKIENKKGNILIVPETLTGLFFKNNYCKRIIWWLSWDFYFETLPRFYGLRKIKNKRLKHLWPIVAILGILKGSIFCKNYKFREKDVKHMYNSEYVYRNLINRGISKKNMTYLCGPVSSRYNINEEKRFKLKKNKDKYLVAYNPAKDRVFNEKVIKRLKQINPKIKSVAIEKMSESEVYHTLEIANVYIDFGFFPGPERIPREATLLGCKIITSRMGAANNQKDIAISNDLKFEKKDSNINLICEKIEYLINNDDFDFNRKYRENVKNQITDFKPNVKSISENWFYN